MYTSHGSDGADFLEKRNAGSNFCPTPSTLENEKDATKILEIIDQAEKQDPSKLPFIIYSIITFTNPTALNFANQGEKRLLCSKLEECFSGPNATLTATPSNDGRYFPHVVSSNLMQYAELLNSTVLATCIAKDSHFSLDKALIMILNAYQQDSSVFQYFIEKTFPTFQRLTPEIIDQRIKLIRVIGELTFFPRPRPAEFGDRISDSVPVVKLDKSIKEQLSEVIFAFLEQARLFQDPKPNTEESLALNRIAQSMAVGGLAEERYQVKKILPLYPLLIEKITEWIGSFTKSYQEAKAKTGAAKMALLWGDALTNYIQAKDDGSASMNHKEINYAKCLLNLACGQLSGSGSVGLLHKVCHPKFNDFNKYRDGITAEIINQLKDPRSALYAALEASLVPVSYSNSVDSHQDRFDFNSKKLLILRTLVDYNNREVRTLASAFMREHGHQFPALMYHQSPGFYRVTSLRASRPFQSLLRLKEWLRF